MEANEKRLLENFLIREGLAGLSDPDLIQQLANLVTNFPGDRHRFLEDLINQCDADKRTEMYGAIAPKLGFAALPLSDYEVRIRNRASELVSQRRMRVEGEAPRPIEVAGEKYEAVSEAEATACMVTVTCYKCPKKKQYISDTPAGCMIMARKDGWVRDKGVNKEICKQCYGKRLFAGSANGKKGVLVA